MKWGRHSVTYALMISSIVLLLVLQFFWLRSAYEKAYLDLRKETNGLFRSTVFALRDSALLKNMQPMAKAGDSTGAHSTLHFTQRILSNDTLRKGPRIQVAEQSKSVQIFIGSTAKLDSVKTIIQPLASKINDGKIPGGGFIFRLELDSLSADTLTSHFAKTLAEAGIDAAFAINFSKAELPPIDLPASLGIRPSRNPDIVPDGVHGHVFGSSIQTDWVRYDPLHRYSVTLSGIRPILLKGIVPQALFSTFLTLVTCGAFLMMIRSLRAQEKLMELKNDFISNISHELKTPVTTVSVALEALKNFRGLENPKLTEEYLDIAQNELNRLTLLTDKVLKTAIFETKGVSFEPEPVDLEKLIGQILGSMKLLFEKQKATVTFEKDGENFVISGGSVHLTNVIYNLLDNALKYSPGEPNIRVSLNNRENQIEILVQDNGIGIPAEFRKKVFEKFFRVPTGDVHNTKGYGLGLSYVDSVIRSHRGTIEVTAGSGPGSLFKIVLPK